MALHDKVAKLQNVRTANGGSAVPESFQGVTKQKVRQVLQKLDLGNNVDMIDGVFALLDDQTPSWFSKAPAGATIADGATTAHIACHVGILQRGGGKLDREGRDAWIKPLRELGGIEAITLQDKEYLASHVKAKSPNSSYRLEEKFKEILLTGDNYWQTLLDEWASGDAARERRAFQAEMAEAARLLIDTGHEDLIASVVQHYCPRFLPGFEVLYIDDSDGDRISASEQTAMLSAGAQLVLGDAMPDVLLWHPGTDELWVIEAVTSDGEVDAHKVTQVKRMAKRNGKPKVGFTTAYRTWKEAAARQATHKNIAVDTYIWIQSDPAKHFKVEG